MLLVGLRSLLLYGREEQQPDSSLSALCACTLVTQDDHTAQ